MVPSPPAPDTLPHDATPGRADTVTTNSSTATSRGPGQQGPYHRVLARDPASRQRESPSAPRHLPLDTRLRRCRCDGSNRQKFDSQYWQDTGELRLRPINGTTCLGDDTEFGWGSEIFTTMNCDKGEARFNFRFDNDPGPNAALLVF